MFGIAAKFLSAALWNLKFYNKCFIANFMKIFRADVLSIISGWVLLDVKFENYIRTESTHNVILIL